MFEVAREPSITVIISNYNYARFLRQSIESVLSQNYPNKRLIVVDDASIDSSREVIESYQNQLTAIFQDENRGHGAAFNAGYAQSDSDLIMFLDADDFLKPNVLKIISEDFRPEVALYQYHMDLVDGDGRVYDVFPKFERRLDADSALQKVLDCGRYVATVTSGLVFSRRYLSQVMPMNADAFRQGADGYLVTLAPLYGDVTTSETIISAYRQHQTNHSAFSQALAQKSQWHLAHNKARYGALREHAKRRQLGLREPLPLRDELNLEQMLCSHLFDPNSDISTARWRLALRAISAIKKNNDSVVNKLITTLWWLSAVLTPSRLARVIYCWRLQPQSRPDWVSGLARRLRTI